SLRKAILDANYLGSVNGGITSISFAIPTSDPGYQTDPVSGASWFTIAPQTGLPDVAEPVFIDGYTQPAAQVNTLAHGDNAVLTLALNGSQAHDDGSQRYVGSSPVGLNLIGGSATIRGLVVNSFPGSGIAISSNNNIIEGDYIGTDVTG